MCTCGGAAAPRPRITREPRSGGPAGPQSQQPGRRGAGAAGGVSGAKPHNAATELLPRALPLPLSAPRTCLYLPIPLSTSSGAALCCSLLAAPASLQMQPCLADLTAGTVLCGSPPLPHHRCSYVQPLPFPPPLCRHSNFCPSLPLPVHLFRCSPVLLAAPAPPSLQIQPCPADRTAGTVCPARPPSVTTGAARFISLPGPPPLCICANCCTLLPPPSLAVVTVVCGSLPLPLPHSRATFCAVRCPSPSLFVGAAVSTSQALPLPLDCMCSSLPLALPLCWCGFVHFPAAPRCSLQVQPRAARCPSPSLSMGAALSSSLPRPAFPSLSARTVLCGSLPLAPLPLSRCNLVHLTTPPRSSLQVQLCVAPCPFPPLSTGAVSVAPPPPPPPPPRHSLVLLAAPPPPPPPPSLWVQLCLALCPSRPAPPSLPAQCCAAPCH